MSYHLTIHFDVISIMNYELIDYEDEKFEEFKTLRAWLFLSILKCVLILNLLDAFTFTLDAVADLGIYCRKELFYWQ